MSRLFVDRPIGIDLGTTHSEVAILDPSESDLLVYADRFGRRTMPSAVAWDSKREEIVVGRAARAHRTRRAPPIESIKRKMGQDVRVKVGPRELTPEEVSSHILRQLREDMSAFLAARASADVDVRVARAVITVPAYFDAPQMEATRRAGELAGIDVLGILQEPTAAAIYHAWKSQVGDGNYLVYDLGGGTFDVSVLRCIGGEYQVLAIDGDNFLGGDDFDRRYAEHLRKSLAEQGYTLDLDVAGDEVDRKRFQRLVHVAQEIKESLSTTEVLSVSKDDVLVDQEGEPISLELEVGRSDYEAIISDLVEDTLRLAKAALAESQRQAGVGPDAIDHVILVGGSTRVPLVQRLAHDALVGPSRAEALRMEEVDTCVALGAAIHAAQLGGLSVGLTAEGEGSGEAQGADEGSPPTPTPDLARITIRSPLVTRTESLRLRLDVDVAPPGTSRLELLQSGAPVASAELDDIPARGVKLKLTLPEPEPAPRGHGGVPLELLLLGEDAGAGPHATLPFSAYRGDVRPRASALSKPSVVAKDLALEVARAGRRERKVLIPRGAGLPASAEERFFTADQSGAVVLRLLQNRLPIKTLVVDVPAELPLGTPVDLRLRCDESMRIEAHATVDGQELWAQVEPARLEVAADDAAIEALLAEAEGIARNLWGHEARRFSREYEPLASGLREVLRVDPDKARALALRLHGLVAEFRGSQGDALSPPLHRFEHTLDAVRRIVYRAQGPLMGMSNEAWDERITDLDQRARGAWDARDAAVWRRCYNEAQALEETAVQQEFATRDLNDPAQLAGRKVNLIWALSDVRQRLHAFVLSNDAAVAERQSKERDRLLSRIDETSGRMEAIDPGDPKRARAELDRASAELERVHVATERLPQLGLVSESS